MVDQKDVQGFILRGYGKMRSSRYALLNIKDKALANQWLSKISGTITDGTHFPETTCLNLAVTYAGLRALGMNADNLRNFGREFREGMVTPHRQRILGDNGDSCPDNWRWGGNSKGEPTDAKNIHLMLLVFGKNEELLNEFYNQVEAELNRYNITVIKVMEGTMRDDNKEHFGFADGIAQPTIKGIGDDESNKHNTVATGEFLLGYKNEYGVFPESPFITTPQGDMNLLPTDGAGTQFKDIGKNGSYLVFRQMEQHVDRFWNFLNETTKSEDGSLNTEESIKLAAKMMGRWPSGAPLVKYPDRDPGGFIDEDDFGYTDDKEGCKCPFGSHIRRNNPRDVFEDNKPKLSLKLTNKHRILRRGRSYGEPLAGTPTDYKPKGEIGLNFMCVNSDIAKQFEFLQHTWSSFPRFQNLYNDPDPISGICENSNKELVQNFTVQGSSVNKCVSNLQSFVTVRGGAYFFFPSISAINFLASL